MYDGYKFKKKIHLRGVGVALDSLVYTSTTNAQKWLSSIWVMFFKVYVNIGTYVIFMCTRIIVEHE